MLVHTGFDPAFRMMDKHTCVECNWSQQPRGKNGHWEAEINKETQDGKNAEGNIQSRASVVTENFPKVEVGVKKEPGGLGEGTAVYSH